MNTGDDVYGYSKKGVDELRKIISNLVRNQAEVVEQKKTMVSAANDTIKDIKDRLKHAIASLTLAESAGADVAHDKVVDEILKKGNFVDHLLDEQGL